MKWSRLLGTLAAASGVGVLPAYAQTPSSNPNPPTNEELQREVDELKARLDAAEGAPPAAAPAKKKPKGELKFYGHLDLSFDYGTKGLASRVQNDGTRPSGDQDWLPAVASNSSFVGVRGYREFVPGALRGIFQVEAQVDASATPGPTTDNTVKGALAYRNTHVGLSGPWGALAIGRNDSPYKSSTRRLDPFYATVGAYTSIMHNTGGDNRAEFDQRFPHAVWYNSPSFGPLSFHVLFAPGQNRSQDNLDKAYSEPICTGGNEPPCNDGSYGSAYSASAQVAAGPLYVTAAWELHHNVNRATDEAANGGASPNGSIGIANEWAVQGAIQYTLPTETTIGAVVEKLNRHNPYVNQWYNERDRWGWWVEGTQKLGGANAVSVGWAHASRTPGDVGTTRSDGTTATGPVDNQSNMLTAGLWHYFADGTASVYLVYARQMNHDGAHYDLGAVTHGIAYDGKDGLGNTFAGSTIEAASVGMTYNF